MCSSVFALLASSMTRSTSASFIFSQPSNSPLLRLTFQCFSAVDLFVVLTARASPNFVSFGRPLSSVSLLCGVVAVLPQSDVLAVGVVCDTSPRLLSESWILIFLGDLVKRPYGPRNTVPLLLGSCASSGIGLLMCFLRKDLWSAAFTVCLMHDIAT